MGRIPYRVQCFFYVKKAHENVIPGIKEYVHQFTADEAIGDMGYLVDRGLIPLSSSERKQVRDAAINLKPNL